MHRVLSFLSSQPCRAILNCLWDIRLTHTIHEPCLYSGLVDRQHVLFLCQVGDFTIACSDVSTANKLLDMLDNFPLKRMGLLDLYNGLDVIQTRNYIKINCSTYIELISEKHFSSRMRSFAVPTRQPTPLPGRNSFIKTFLSATGDPDPKQQEILAKTMGSGYHSGIGELIYALITCRPDISYAVVRCTQNSVCPAEIHYHAVKHILKYLYLTRNDGLHYWCAQPNESLPAVQPPKINSNAHDILLDGRPIHNSLKLHGFVDAD